MASQKIKEPLLLRTLSHGYSLEKILLAMARTSRFILLMGSKMTRSNINYNIYSYINMYFDLSIFTTSGKVQLLV